MLCTLQRIKFITYMKFKSFTKYHNPQHILICTTTLENIAVLQNKIFSKVSFLKAFGLLISVKKPFSSQNLRYTFFNSKKVDNYVWQFYGLVCTPPILKAWNIKMTNYMTI